MCGINGIFAYGDSASSPDRKELIATRDHMLSRGPDGYGEWWSDCRRLGFSHQRLAIIDLSNRAAQPMASHCGRFMIVFNGEIYNYAKIRRELEKEGAVFHSESDTEVLLNLYALKREKMVRDLRGMFAFAIWDNVDRELFLARDPYGIKPLYTADDGTTLRFASQAKALLAGGHVSRDPEPAGVVGFYLWGSVPEPFTLYREIRQLPAGHTQRVTQAGINEPVPYASIAEALAKGSDPSFEGIDRVNDLVRNATLESVKAHLVADVEVGIFLSAGVDSGALLGLMKDAGQAKVRAITLSFDEFGETVDDETPIARDIAELYGAEHLVRTVSKQEFEADLPAILDAMDQPSIDGINSWFVAKAASEAGLKIAFSGVGGDELFAGYPSFRDVPRWVSSTALLSAVPGLGVAVRVLLDQLAGFQIPPKAAALFEYGGTYAGSYLLRRGLFLPHEMRSFIDPLVLKDGLRKLNPLGYLEDSMTPDPKQQISRVAALESCNYMRHQLLRDADWAGMAHSLEIRTPLVDFSLLQAICPAMPMFFAGVGKKALAIAPETPLPSYIINRPKTGFGVPTQEWMAGENNLLLSRNKSTSRMWSKNVFSHFSKQINF
jgi:asparagine synthase (glutamine-hydrolysing)